MKRGPAICTIAETTLLNLMLSDDWYDHLASLRSVVPPGTKFEYNSVNYHQLSILIHESSGMCLDKFADKYLFTPIGITDFEWDVDPHDNPYGFGNLKLKPSDLARIAYLIKNRGQWKTECIIPKQWIESMLTPYHSAGWNPILYLNYGYGMFLPNGIRNNFYAGLGRGGQCFYIFPENDLIIITMGNFDSSKLIFHLSEKPNKHLILNQTGSAICKTENQIISVSGKIPPRKLLDKLSGKWIVTDNNIFDIDSILFTSRDNTIDFKIIGKILNLQGAFSVDSESPLVLFNIFEHQLLPRGYSFLAKKVAQS